MSEKILPEAYVRKRFHSLAGIWLVAYLSEHLLTNSQAALFIGDYGQGFVHMVNKIHDLPYLPAIEILLLAVPLLMHMVYGVRYLFTARLNSRFGKASAPLLKEYPRNHAFSWQRITSWILLVGILLHVVQMRFVNYPLKVDAGLHHQYYMVRLDMDPGLYAPAPKLNIHFYTDEQIQKEKQNLLMHGQRTDAGTPYQSEVAEEVRQRVMTGFLTNYIETLSRKPLKNNEVIAVSGSFGVATLLSVRETFKNPWMISLYTIFVIAACFHAFNGLRTAMISWGITLSARSQTIMGRIAVLFSMLLALLGLSAVWLTYLVNLR